jgi:perosamine synthetase
MIRLARPQISEDAIAKVADVLRSGNLVQGKYVRQFEKDLEKYLGVDHAIVVSSGTAALHLSLIALGIGPGHEVIVPTFSFPATANVVEAVGATPVFVDITLEDYCIDTTLVEDAITMYTKAIMPVHEFGQTAKIDHIVDVAKNYDLEIIEDAACALGSEYKGKKAGTFGGLGCFSFHPRKAITTGEGGAIVTNDSQLAEKLRAIRNHGITTINSKVKFMHAGLNYRITDFQAAIGLAQLNGLNKQIDSRIRLAQIYDSYISSLSWVKSSATFADRKCVYQTYHVLFEDEDQRERVISSLNGAHIEVNIGAYALPNIHYYKKKYHLPQNKFVNAKHAQALGLALPIGSHVTTSQIEFIMSQFKRQE